MILSIHSNLGTASQESVPCSYELINFLYKYVQERTSEQKWFHVSPTSEELDGQGLKFIAGHSRLKGQMHNKYLNRLDYFTHQPLRHRA